MPRCALLSHPALAANPILGLGVKVELELALSFQNISNDEWSRLITNC
jgi:hypothetical protein